MSMKTHTVIEKIACVASRSPKAQAGLAALAERYELVSVDEADVVVALGGDGFLLQTVHDHLKCDVPIYGMNRGTVGFLLNEFMVDDLPERLNRAQRHTLSPLRMEAVNAVGDARSALAFNEVALHRYSQQSAHIRVSINGRVRLEELVCDGIMVATRRVHGLQPVGAGPHHPAGVQRAGADAGVALSAAPLERGAAAARGRGPVPGP